MENRQNQSTKKAKDDKREAEVFSNDLSVE